MLKLHQLHAKLQRELAEIELQIISERDRLLGPYVQVSFYEDTLNRKYTYCDPTDACAVGDVVQVPVGSDNKIKLAEVVALGKGTYSGTPYKSVKAILHREEL